MDRIDEPVDETVDLITPSEEVVDPPATEESLYVGWANL